MGEEYKCVCAHIGKEICASIYGLSKELCGSLELLLQTLRLIKA